MSRSFKFTRGLRMKVNAHRMFDVNAALLAHNVARTNAGYEESGQFSDASLVKVLPILPFDKRVHTGKR